MSCLCLCRGSAVSCYVCCVVLSVYLTYQEYILPDLRVRCLKPTVDCRNPRLRIMNDRSKIPFRKRRGHETDNSRAPRRQADPWRTPSFLKPEEAALRLITSDQPPLHARRGSGALADGVSASTTATRYAQAGHSRQQCKATAESRLDGATRH